MGSSASKKKNVDQEPEIKAKGTTKDGNNNKKVTNKKTRISHEGNGRYEPYTEFPDIQRMREAQQDFKESTYDIDNDDDDVPEPFPAVVTKEEIYKKYNFAKIDIHVHNTPPSLARDVQQLVEYLCRDTNDDIEKVRALFAWISSRDRENTIIELGNGPQAVGTPLDHLVKIMNYALTYEYNALFALLCKEAGIPHKRVSGRIRASAKDVGGPVTSTGNYFIVFAEGNWHFIHPHWGSCYVRSITSPDDWLLIEGVQGQKSSLASGTIPSQLAYAREDFWFFTNPEVMSHFFLSVQEDTQLLARPIRQNEFQVMARLYQPFFTREFESISPARCKSNADESFTIDIGLPNNDKMEFDYGIFKRAVDPNWPWKKASKEFKKLTFMERIGNKLRVRFDMPFIGVYKFEISSHEIFRPESVQTLCEYVIENQTPNFSCRVNPANNLNEWGAGTKAKAVGLEPEQEGGLIEAEEGKAMVKFRLRITDKKKLKFNYKLEDEKGQTTYQTEDLKDFVRHSNTEDKSRVIIRTPHHGKYVLRVQAKEESERDFKDVCNYLVTSDRGVADDTPFPKAPNGQIGPLEKEKIVIEPISHTDPIIEEVPAGHIEIKMKENGDFEVLPKLLLDNQNKSEYVYHYKKSKDERVYVLFLPSAGWYSFKIFARRRGSTDDHQLAFTYVVIATEPKPSCVPFPQRLPAWKDEFIIIEPKDGQLPQNQNQRFRLKIPGAESVTLTQGKNEIKLNKVNLKKLDDSKNIKGDTDKNDKDDKKDDIKDDKKDDKKDAKKDKKANLGAIKDLFDGDIWEAEMDTGDDGEEIKVVVVQKGKNTAEEVVMYKVLSGDDSENVQKLQKQADLEATKRREKIEKRAKEEENKATVRKTKIEDHVKKSRNDFAKNKDTYIAKQRRLDEEALQKESVHAVKEFQGRTEKKKETGNWKEMQLQILKEMRLEKLREAIKSRDRERLDKAIQEAREHGVPEDEDLLIQADKELDVLVVRDELRETLTKREPEAIKACIQKIFDNNFYYSRLQPDVAEALQILERLQRTLDMRVDHLEMKPALFGELKRYNSPPKIVHEVIQATLLLFELDEETTEEWKTCQKHLSPSGPHSMTRRILDFDSSRVHPEVAARCKEILEQYEIQKAREVSPAAATFYAWSMGAVESLLPEGNNIQPASIKRQCELFGHPKSPKREKYDFRFSMRKKEKSLDGSTVNSTQMDDDPEEDD